GLSRPRGDEPRMLRGLGERVVSVHADEIRRGAPEGAGHLRAAAPAIAPQTARAPDAASLSGAGFVPQSRARAAAPRASRVRDRGDARSRTEGWFERLGEA